MAISPERTVRQRTERRAFTLVELFVVMAITALLVGLLIPAVQAIRAAAAKMFCQNKLKQIGLALHNYHSSEDCFPVGISVNADFPHLFLGWTARILPYLESETTWRAVESAFATDPNPNQFYGHEPHHQLLATPVREFACPSDSRMPGPALTRSGIEVSFTSYLGVSGRDLFHLDGSLFLDSHVRIVDVRDGASNTLIVGERPPAKDHRYGWWYRGWGQNQDGSAEMLLGVRELNIAEPNCSAEPARFQAGSFDNQCALFHYWSPHTDGANFLFVDGSVRFLTYAADPVIVDLASREGGEVVQVP